MRTSVHQWALAAKLSWVFAFSCWALAFTANGVVVSRDISKEDAEELIAEIAKARASLITSKRLLRTTQASLNRIERRVMEMVVPGTEPDEPDDDDDVPPDEDDEGDIPGTSDWDQLPFEVPPIPGYEIPRLEDCEWVFRDGDYLSRRGLPDESSIRDAYRASIRAGHDKPIDFGVYGAMGRVVAGGSWGADDPGSVTMRRGDGSWARIEVAFVGLDDSAEIGLGWSDRFGYPEFVGAYNIGLRGPNDSFIIRATSPAGDLRFDGCKFLPAPGVSHESGAHMSEYESLVWRNHQDDGFVPQHHWLYLKACVADDPDEGTWIVGNRAQGGARTVCMWRPETGDRPGDPGSSRPAGPIVIADNVFASPGWGNEHPDGGGAISVWGNPDNSTYIFNNVVEDARYSALTLSSQARDRDYLNDNGFPIQTVYLYGNKFDAHRSDRDLVSLTSCEVIEFYGSEIYSGPGGYGDLMLDNPWVVNGGTGIKNGELRIHRAPTLRWLERLRIRTYRPGGGRNDAEMYDKRQLPAFFVAE